MSNGPDERIALWALFRFLRHSKKCLMARNVWKRSQTAQHGLSVYAPTPWVFQPWTQWRNGQEKTQGPCMDRFKSPRNNNLKYPHFRIKGLVWKENDDSETNKCRFWQKSVESKVGQWSMYNNFCPALYSKIIFQLFPLFTSNQFT